MTSSSSSQHLIQIYRPQTPNLMKVTSLNNNFISWMILNKMNPIQLQISKHNLKEGNRSLESKVWAGRN